ncbi:MAG: hydrogenase/urease maturation nickel metallochaperone HypA [Gaiellaceae bacterium]
MHEQTLIRDVMSRIDGIARAEGATRVTRVQVRLGALTHFTPAHFCEHFEDAAQGTLAEGAIVDAEVVGDVGSERAHEVVLESVEIELPDELPDELPGAGHSPGDAA